jgi:pimeloyl-ACP methyl ester carboxylesterase
VTSEADVGADDPWSRWADHDGLRLHYLDSGADRPDGSGAAEPDPGVVPAVFVPGFGEEAAEHRPLLEALLPRRVIAVDLRGRGRSDVPDAGYTLDAHVADLDAIVRAAGLDRVHVLSYSRGTTYALGWAVSHADQVAAVVVGDYAAHQMVPPEWFGTAAIRRKWRGRPIVERMSAPAIQALLADAADVPLWDDLARLRVPALLIRGVAEGAIATDAVEARYRAALPQLEVVRFEESGHDLWDPDPGRYAATVRDFLARADASAGV